MPRTLTNIPCDTSHHRARRLDIFLPDAPAGDGRAILFIHGGAWSSGSKEKWHEVMDHFCARGYVCASCGYRLAPAHRFPAAVEDVRRAMAFLKREHERYGIDPSRIATYGSSSGAHLAAMLATIAPDDPLGGGEDLAPNDTRPAAVVSLCGVLSVHSYADNVARMMRTFLGTTEDENPQRIREASPVDRIGPDMPPVLCICGDTDTTTPLWLSETMVDRSVDAGNDARLVVLAGAPHGFGYGVHSDYQKQTLAAVEPFLQEILSA